MDQTVDAWALRVEVIPRYTHFTGQDVRDLFRTRAVLGERVGWMEGPDGVGPLHFSQNALRIIPMMVHPMTLFTPSIIDRAGLRIANA